MTRVKRGVTAHARAKKTLSKAKGFRWKRSNVLKNAQNAVAKAQAHAYRSRKLRKRDFRSLWITRVSAAAKQNGVRYSDLLAGLTKKNVVINRKMLSELAIHNPSMFTQIVELAKA